jgi:hypothetical protein
MSQSDSKLVTELWTHFSTMSQTEWACERDGACPRCDKELYRVPLRYKSKSIRISGCVHCYMLIMPHEALAYFQLESPSTKTKNREATRMKLQDEFRETHKKVWNDLNDLLTKTYAFRGSHVLVITLAVWALGRGNLKIDLSAALALSIGVLLVWRSGKIKNEPGTRNQNLPVRATSAAPLKKSA